MRQQIERALKRKAAALGYQLVPKSHTAEAAALGT
jgi:hypothetical protein